MKSLVYWIPRLAVFVALVALLAACGSVPTAQSQSGSVADPRPAENSAIDQELLKQVDAQIAAAKARGEDVSTAQSVRDSAVSLAQQGNVAEANGNLKLAAQLVGVLRSVSGEPTAAPVPAIAAAPAPAISGDEQGAVLFSSKFDSDTDLASWQRIGPPIRDGGTPLWKVEKGLLTQRGVDGVTTVEIPTSLVNGDPKWTDVTVRANVLARGTKELGLIVRQQGESYYYFRVSAFGDGNQGNLSLQKVVNDEATTIAEFDGPSLAYNTWTTLALSATGSTLRCYVNGKLVGSAEDTTLTSGRAGVVTLAMSGAYFKTVQVIGR